MNNVVLQPFYAAPRPLTPLEIELNILKEYMRRNVGCFYCILIILAIYALFGVVQSMNLISDLRNDENNLIPRISIGFIVFNLIQDVLNIAVISPAKSGLYMKNEKKMALTVKIFYLILFVFIFSNIFYIIYLSKLENGGKAVFFVVINIICGLLLYVSQIMWGRIMLVRIRRINEIEMILSGNNANNNL